MELVICEPCPISPACLPIPDISEVGTVCIYTEVCGLRIHAPFYNKNIFPVIPNCIKFTAAVPGPALMCSGFVRIRKSDKKEDFLVSIGCLEGDNYIRCRIMCFYFPGFSPNLICSQAVNDRRG